MIEEILDLKKHLAKTDNEDVKLVYENLMKGSMNHLRAFMRNLEKYGVTYEPQYLSADFNILRISSPSSLFDAVVITCIC